MELADQNQPQDSVQQQDDQLLREPIRHMESNLNFTSPMLQKGNKLKGRNAQSSNQYDLNQN